MGGKKCYCGKRANFNFKDCKQVKFCNIHKEPGMINIMKQGNFLCRECNTQASFGEIGASRSEVQYCSIHKKDGMVNIVNKHCLECFQLPTFAFRGEKAEYCNIHKKPGMINVKSPICIECGILANFGIKGGKIQYCSGHKKPNMINLSKRTCIECSRLPGFGYSDGKMEYCAIHKKSNMIDLKHKKCEYELCGKSPSYGFVGKQPERCVIHKLPDMIDVKHKKCKLCDITNAKNNKYKGYCSFCFKNKFPDHPLSRNFKTKEKAVNEFVKQEFSNINWKFDKTLGGCSNRRPDIFGELETHVIIIETDENSHSRYDTSCENKRLCELYEDIAYRNMYVFRFNPDSYTDSDGDKIKSPWSLSKTGVLSIKDKKEWNDRLQQLKIGIQTAIENIPEKSIDIQYYFFDSKELDSEESDCE